MINGIPSGMCTKKWTRSKLIEYEKARRTYIHENVDKKCRIMKREGFKWSI